jgi:ATP-binding cassette subfamily F protein 3
MNHIRINIERYETNKKEILRDISFILNESDRVAIVGPNGAGKTTLLKILSGEITDYVGSIENCKPLSLGYLAQIHFDQEHLLVRDELKRAFREIESFEQKLKQLEQHMQENASDLDAISRYSEALETFNTIGGYTYEYEIHRVANGLGIVDLLDRSIREVSG